MLSRSQDRFTWIAIATISGLSTVNTVATMADDDRVLSFAAIFWMAIAVGAAVAAFLFHSTLKRDVRGEDLDV